MTNERWTNLETPDGEMRVYVARPEKPKGRAVVILQEAFGVNEHIQDIARRFAAEGYVALAPDLFHRAGIEELPYTEHGRAVALIGQIGVPAIAVDVAAVLAHLQVVEGITSARTAVVGFCFGGRAAFTAATQFPTIGATVVFYGPGIAAGPHAVLDQAAAITGPVLLHVGSADPTIPADQANAIATALDAAGVQFEQYVYAGAGHAFACDARPQMYRPAAAAQAWARTYAFLDQQLPAA